MASDKDDSIIPEAIWITVFTFFRKNFVWIESVKSTIKYSILLRW